MTQTDRHCPFSASPVRGLVPYAAMLLIAVSGATPASAQSCQGGSIRDIMIERGEPFAGEAVARDATLGWWFRFMNALHVRTLETTVRWELLFREGDCHDPVLLSESERSLRSLPFITDASVTSERTPDGAHLVRVRTSDTWAMAGGVSLSLDDGVSIAGISGSAKNVLGSGTRLSAFRTVFRERERKGFLVRQPNLFGSRVDATVHGGRTRAGRNLTQSVLRPYAGEGGRSAFRQSYHRRDDYFSYSSDPARDFSQAFVRFDTELFEATYQRRFGAVDGTRLVFGAGFSREVVSFLAGAQGVLVVRDNDFGSPVQADAGVIQLLADQMAPWATNRLNVTVGMRRASFVRRTGFDALRAAQDVPLGGEVLLTAAPAVSAGRDDWLFRGQGGFGLGRGRAYAHVETQVQGRRLASPGAAGRWKDLMLEIQSDAYWAQSDVHSLYARASFAAGTNMERPFQLTLGGREAIRGYGDDAFPGGQRLMGTLEQRIRLDALSTGFADVGLSVFTDAGRVWAGTVPFGGDSGWRAALGGGFRFGLPGGGVDVVRVDFAVPLTDTDGGGSAGLRISAELLGLLDRRGWPTQMERSRWHGIDADLATRPVQPLARN